MTSSIDEKIDTNSSHWFIAFNSARVKETLVSASLFLMLKIKETPNEEFLFTWEKIPQSEAIFKEVKTIKVFFPPKILQMTSSGSGFRIWKDFAINATTPIIRNIFFIF